MRFRPSALGVASLLSMFALTAGIAKGMREYMQQIGGIERVGGHTIVARRFQLANHEQGDADEDANRESNRRREPPVIDRVAQEEDRGEDQSNS